MNFIPCGIEPRFEDPSRVNIDTLLREIYETFFLQVHNISKTRKRHPSEEGQVTTWITVLCRKAAITKSWGVTAHLILKHPENCIHSVAKIL